MSDDTTALPMVAEPVVITPAPKPVKVATPDIILVQQDKIPVDTMTDLVFEDIGGQELITIARGNLVNGQNISYQLIGNLKEIEQQFNSKNIIPLPGSADKYFNSKPINLLTHIPEVGTGDNGEHVYQDAETGQIIINVVNLAENEQVEVEIISPQTVFNDTIY